MTSILGGIGIGIVYGALVGLCKYIFLWKGLNNSDRKLTTGALYVRMGIGYAINVLTLLFVFLARNIMPVDYMATLIATAVALSIMGKIVPMRDIVNNVSEEKTL